MAGHEKSRYRETFADEAALIGEIRMLGWSRFWAADSSLRGHAHHGAWEICYIVRGKVDWWRGDRVYAVGPGDFFVTRPDEVHGGVDAIMQPCELYWVVIGAGMGRGPEWGEAKRRLEGLRQRRFAGTAAGQEIFERLMEEHRRGERDGAAVVRAWLLALVLEALRCHDAAERRGTGREVSTGIAGAMRWIGEHIEDGGLEGASAAAGLGMSQFHMRFVRETGYSPGEYRGRLRIERAKVMLREEGRSVTEVALGLGFSSSQYFATSFRKYTGMSPGEFRRGSGAEQAASGHKRVQ